MDSTSTTAVATLSGAMAPFADVLRNRRGAASVEYALLAAMIAAAALVGLAPFGKALAQELSGFSRDLGLMGASAAGCRRVEWTDAELRYQATFKHTPEPSPLP